MMDPRANSTAQSAADPATALTQSVAASDSATQSTTADNANDQASTTTDSANTAMSTNSSTAQNTEADQTIINSKQNSAQAPATDNIQHGINIIANNQTGVYPKSWNWILITCKLNKKFLLGSQPCFILKWGQVA